MHVHTKSNKTKIEPFYRRVINELEAFLQDQYYILVEFDIPNSRQVDIIVLLKDGFYLFELKNRKIAKISLNSDWVDISGNVVNNKFKRNFESPYEQAKNSADGFRDWVKWNVKNINHQDRKIFQSKAFCVFPTVVIEDYVGEYQDIQEDSWAKVVFNLADIYKIFNRKWKNTNGNIVTIHTQTLETITKQLGLELFDSQKRTKKRPGGINRTLQTILDIMFRDNNALTDTIVRGRFEDTVRKQLFEGALDAGVKLDVIARTLDGKIDLEPKTIKLMNNGVKSEEILENYYLFNELTSVYEGNRLYFDVFVSENYENQDIIKQSSIRVDINIPHELKSILLDTKFIDSSRTPFLFRQDGYTISEYELFENSYKNSKTITEMIDEVEDSNVIVIIGPAASGKSNQSRYLAYKYYKEGYYAFSVNHKSLDTITTKTLTSFCEHTENRSIIVVEDIHLGGSVYINNIINLMKIENANNKLLITSRNSSVIEKNSSFNEILESKEYHTFILNNEIIGESMGNMLMTLQDLAYHKSFKKPDSLQNIIKLCGYSFIHLNLIMVGLLEEIDDKYTENFQINIQKLIDDEINLENILNASSMVLGSKYSEYIKSKIDNAVHLVNQSTKQVKLLIKRVLLSTWVLGELEMKITSSHISNIWKYPEEDISAILGSLEYHGEISSDGAFYKLNHPQHGSIILEYISEIEDWSDLIVDFSNQHDLDMSVGFKQMYIDVSKIMDENFVLINDEEVGITISSTVEFKELSKSLTLSELMDLYWTNIDELRLQGIEYEVWYVLDLDMIISLINDEEDIKSILYLHEILYGIDYPYFYDLMDEIGVDGYVSLLLNLPHIRSELERMKRWNFIKFPFVITELFYELLSESKPNLNNLDAVSRYPSLIEFIDENEVVNLMQDNPRMDFSIFSDLKLFKRLYMKVITQIIKLGVEKYSFNLVDTALGELSRLDNKHEKQYLNLVNLIKQWDINIIVKALNEAEYLEFWNFLYWINELNKSMLPVIFTHLSYDTVLDYVLQGEYLHNQLHDIRQLEKYGFNRIIDLLNEVGSDEIIPFILNDKFATIGYLPFLVEQEWEGKNRILEFTEDEFKSLQKKHNYGFQVPNFMLKYNIKGGANILFDEFMNSCRDSIYQLDRIVKLFEEYKIDWKSKIDPIEIEEILSALAESDRKRLVQFLNDKGLSYTLQLEKKNEKIGEKEIKEREIRYAQYLKEAVLRETQELKSKLQKKGIEIGGLSILGESLYYIYREFEKGIRMIRDYVEDPKLMKQPGSIEVLSIIFKRCNQKQYYEFLKLFNAKTCVRLLNSMENYYLDSSLSDVFNNDKDFYIDIFLELILSDRYFIMHGAYRYRRMFPAVIGEEETLNEYVELMTLFFLENTRLDLIQRILEKVKAEYSKILEDNIAPAINLLLKLPFTSTQWQYVNKVYPDKVKEQLLQELMKNEEYERLLILLINIENIPKDNIESIITYIKSLINSKLTDVTTELWILYLIYIKDDDLFDFDEVLNLIEVDKWDYYWKKGDGIDRKHITSILSEKNPELLKRIQEEVMN